MLERLATKPSEYLRTLRARSAALARRPAPAGNAARPDEKPAPARLAPDGTTTADGPPTSIFGLAYGPLTARIAELAALSLAINLLSLAVPIFVLQVYDRVVFHGGLVTLAGLLIGVVAALIFDFVLRQARSRLVQMVALRIDIGVIRALFDKLTSLPMRKAESQSDADWHGLLRDQETVRDTIAGPALILLVDLPFVLLFIGVIWLVAQPIAWLLLALVPVYLLVAALSSAIVGRASRDEQTSAEGRHFQAAQLVSGRLTAKALGLGEALKTRWETAQAELIGSSLRRGGTVDGFSNLSAEMAMLTTVAMTSVGALSIVAGELTIGGLIAANMLAARVVQPLVQLIGMWRVIARLRDAARRIDSVMQLPSDRGSSAVERGRPKGILTLEHVDFRYGPEEALVLEDIGATLSPGAMVGVRGLNGAGKTTLLNVLQGLYVPERGRVLLDGADMRQFGRGDLSRWIGHAPQETFLFAGSIRDNICKLREDVSDARVLAAARQAGADPFIVDLPDGYDTLIGDGGRRLSAGQRQRIALARALIDNPPVVLLDEPTAHLDAKATDGLIYLLRRLCRERTVVVATHCRELLKACHSVITLDGGRIADTGDDVSGRPSDRPAGRPAGPAGVAA